MLRSFCAVGLLAVGAQAHAGMLVGVDSFGQFSTQSLYSIDSTTGEATVIGSTGIGEIAGLAWNGSSLYAYTVDAELYTLSTVTGAASLVADSFGIVPEGGLDFTDAGGLIASNGSSLGQVDLGTGAFTPIGAFGPAGGDVSGLAFAGGKIFGHAKNGAGDDTLVDIDPMTGTATTVGALGFDSNAAFGGLAWDQDANSLFLTDGFSLFSVDFGTGAATLIGNHVNAGGFSALAVIPAPGTAFLAGLGLAGLARRRRTA